MADDFRQDLKAQDPNALVIGDKVFVQGLSAGGKLFVFTRHQMQFLLALQKLKSPEAAAISVNQTEDWAKKFLSSRKFKSYVANKMQEFSVKNGMTVEWWMQFGKWLADGKKTYFEGVCAYCADAVQFSPYEAEVFRQDDMTFAAECPLCFKPILLKEITEPFHPTREMVEGWKEVGSRILPKVERVHHEFSKEEFTFEAAG